MTMRNWRVHLGGSACCLDPVAGVVIRQNGHQLSGTSRQGRVPVLKSKNWSTGSRADLSGLGARAQVGTISAPPNCFAAEGFHPYPSFRNLGPALAPRRRGLCFWKQFPLGAEVVPIYAGHRAITGAVQPAFSIPIWWPQPHSFWLNRRRTT
jgi:hypothetical protein